MSGTRVLVVSHFFPPESLGGAHRWQKLLESMPEDVEARVLRPPPAFPYGEFERDNRPIRRETVEGVPVTQLWSYQPTRESSLGRILNYVLFSVFASLYVLVNAWRYDTVVTVSAPHTTFLPGVVGKALGLRWVVDVFDLWLDNAVDLGYTEKGSLPYWYVYVLERLAITKSDGVTVITPTMAEAFQEKYGVDDARFTIVPFGVDDELFAPTDGEGHPERVIYTGNMGDAHALVPFVEAFEHLDERYELLLVGTGKRRDELERLARERGLADRVTFHGVVPREEIPPLLSGAAASIVPLKLDYHLDYARPNKLLESMALGTPFVASAVGEIETVTEESGAGLAVENDPEAIADALRTVLEDDERRARMGEAGVAFVEEHHRWPTLAKRVAPVLR